MINTFYLPTRIIFGPGSIDQLGEEAKKIGQKAMIVTYPDIRRIGLLDRVVAILKAKGVDTLIYEKAEPSPRSSGIDEGARMARSEKFDMFIGLGGGSAMDTTKGMALASTGTKSIVDYITPISNIPPPAKGVKPIIQVPTMAGTGSEANAKAVIHKTETTGGGTCRNPSCYAKVAIIDPGLTLTVPRKHTAVAGFDTFSHVADAYLTNEAFTPANDRLREALMKTVVEYLPKALARLDDIEARIQLSWISTIACSPLTEFPGGATASSGGVSVGHSFGGWIDDGNYPATHGEGILTTFVAGMKYILPMRKERIDLLGKNVFGKADGIRAVEEWIEEMGIKIRIRDFGGKLEDIVARASKRLQGRPDLEARLQVYRDSY